MFENFQKADISKAQQDEAVKWKIKGNELFNQGNYEAAISCYDKGLEIDLLNSNLWNNKGLSLYKIGKREEAQKCKEILQILQRTELIEKKHPIEEEEIVCNENIPPVPPEPPGSSLPLTIEKSPIPIQEKLMNESPTTARIHGISGSTQYLLRGMKNINGKKFETFEEINHFYSNYEKILADAEISARKQQEERLAELINEEHRLDKLLSENIARRTFEVDRHINDLYYKILNPGNIFRKLNYQMQYWIQVYFRSYRINNPLSGLSKELKKVRTQKELLISYKQNNIQNECNKVIDSYDFLEQNKSFFIGAQGEELVISILSRLPREYHVLNDVNLQFKPALYWKKNKGYILSSQIDHIVVGPTGIFLIETKNWKLSDIDQKFDDLIFQVQRSSYALWRYLVSYYRQNDLPKIRNIVVSMQGSNTGRKLQKFIDIIAPNQLPGYITERESSLTQEDISKIIRILASI